MITVLLLVPPGKLPVLNFACFALVVSWAVGLLRLFTVTAQAKRWWLSDSWCAVNFQHIKHKQRQKFHFL